ncbi:MAG TPA: alpha/beta fold hydrolase [Candidatus Saccharimonadales bacterium]|nr:alpha/beta fold hydrolase [Candidatus Saccharimonadales bacterium]
MKPCQLHTGPWTAFILIIASALFSRAGDFPPPTEHDYIIKNFHFRSGESLPELRIHYRSWGKPVRDEHGLVRNAVLVQHGTTGSGSQFTRNEFAGELVNKGQPLDAEKYFIVATDGIGHGKSSKPSDGLHAKFPHYGYLDMVEAQFRLLTEGLGVNHLRLVMGTSMGGMHTWVWGEEHPRFMDALLPLACLPTEISGRNRVWRRMIIDSIRGAPDWQNGEYQTQPHGLVTAIETLYFVANNPKQRLKDAPTLSIADQLLDKYIENSLTNLDATDVLYALEASRDYNPGPALERIQARVLAINFADDLINPPELRVLEREIKRVKRGRAILVPESDKTRGHGTHTLAAVWKKQLARFLKKRDPVSDVAEAERKK